jgi:riboflavin kinase/FMN adenylyltransferase
MAKGRIITIGSFDGVHRGHAALLDFTVQAARKRHLKSMALTFKVPPKIVLKQEPSKQLLSDVEEKRYLISRHRLDEIEMLNFNDKILSLKPFHFFRDILLRSYNARGVVVGADFRFGEGRSAGAVELVQWGGEFEIPVWVIPAVRWNGKIISSSSIREALAANRLDAANNLLGHPYIVGGRVVKGHARGRGLGFPTANIRAADGKLLPAGVFAVTGWYAGKTGKKHAFKGVCNIGVRPTLYTGSPVTVEAHLFGTHPDLVGKQMMVELRRRLRGEKKFASADKLAAAIRKDVEQARFWLAKSS